MARRLTKRTATEKFRCRKCELLKKSDDFYRATNTFLDTNQRMSVCKDCVKEIFDSQMTRYENMEKAFLSTCKTIDVMYDENVIAKTHEKMDEMTKSGKSADSIFGIYMRLLFASNVEKDLTFKEPISPILVSEQEINGRDIKKLEDEWGKGLGVDDYIYLENELARWESTHRSDTMAEQTLLHHIAYKQFEIRKARESNPTDTDLSTSLLKQLQDLIKTASIDPGKANAAGQGKNMESFSAFIKMIEETEPAEFYSEKDMFKDIDNIDFYFTKYVTRPLKNFVMGSRDFNVEAEKEGDDEDDSFDISDMGIEDDIPVAKEESPKKEG